MKFFVICFSVLLLSRSVYSQPQVSFINPDSACVGQPITITNTTTGGSTFYWNFCSGNAGNMVPLAVNIGNPSNNLNIPVYITLVQDGIDCFSFITNQGSPTHITRNFHGANFRNDPVSTASIMQNGVLHQYVEGIQIKKEGSDWYGFVNNNSTILRLNFGNSLWNNPTWTDIGPFPNIAIAHGLIITKEGNTWLGFFDSSNQSKLYRLNFGTSLTNTPTFQDLGNVAGFNWPCQISMVRENGINYMMVVNQTNNTISRVNFGNSLFNTPTGQNLGTLGVINNPTGITMINDCETATGFVTSYQPSPNGVIDRLDFPNGVSGPVTAISLGNLGNLDRPALFSEIFRQNDSLFLYVSNRQSSTLTRFSFPPANNATILTSTLYNPTAFSYTQAGTYHIRLVVNEGQPDETTLCKTIVVGPPPTVELGPNRTICQGQSTTLDAGGGFSSYLWSTGATTRTITVSTAGTYSVTVTKFGCAGTDQINVNIETPPVVDLGSDTTICLGSIVTFDAGECSSCIYLWKDQNGITVGTGRTYTTGTAGNYSAAVTTLGGCTGQDSIQLFTVIEKELNVSIQASDTLVCSGSTVSFTASAQNQGNTPFYQWQVNGTNEGTNGPAFSFNPSGFSTIRCILTASDPLCTTHNPDTSNLITIHVNPQVVAAVSIDGRTSGICSGDLVTFTASGLNGGSDPVWQWKVNGTNSGTNSSTLIYNPADNDVIQCTMTSSITECIQNNPANSDTLVTRVNPVQTAGVGVVPSQTQVCSGTEVIFTATPQNPGDVPIYQWTINGTPAGTNQAVFACIPADNDIIVCTMTSSDTLCIINNPAVSSPVTMRVDPLLPVSATIVASDNPVCAGSLVTFIALAVNGGSQPHFQWLRNGTTAGPDLPELSLIPVNNDEITCIVTSSETCTLENPVHGDTVVMIVQDNPVVTMPVCFDTITFMDARPIRLRGGIPYGGVYLGTGVSGGTFFSAVAGAGVHTLTYTYTNAAGCQALASLRIHTLLPQGFHCGDDFTDPRDNQRYSTLKIGSQCWMRDNLNYGKQIKGNLPQRDNCIPEKHCFDDHLFTCVPLYQWDEVMEYEASAPAKGLCPPGWHIPSESEWMVLFSNWTNEAFAGSPLKYSGFSRFNAQLAGAGFQNNTWKFDDWATFFWSCTAVSPYKAWAHAMNEPDFSVAKYSSDVSNAFSVRCIKD